MGLDMCLYKKTYIWQPYKKEEPPAISIIADMECYGHIQPRRVKFIIEEVGYWRKANQIHRWFVEHVGNGLDECQEWEASHEQLTTLLQTVQDVLADHAKAAELLPTQDGFFFGDTEYDTDYFQDLEHTQEVLTEALKDDIHPFSYRASW